jgi:hypothetical protein
MWGCFDIFRTCHSSNQHKTDDVFFRGFLFVEKQKQFFCLGAGVPTTHNYFALWPMGVHMVWIVWSCVVFVEVCMVGQICVLRLGRRYSGVVYLANIRDY